MADQSKVLDYFKYTLALAAGLIVFLPSTFLPADGWRWWLVLSALVLVTISAVLGMMVFGAMSRILGGQEHEPWLPKAVSVIGAAHVLLLVFAFIFGAVLYITHYFFANGERTRDCSVRIRAYLPSDGSDDQQQATIEFDCQPDVSLEVETALTGQRRSPIPRIRSDATW